MPVAVRAILGVLLYLVCYCAAQTQVKIVANPMAIDGPANVTVTWSGVQDYNAQLDVVSAYLLNDNGAIVILLSSMGANESVAAANGTGQLVFSLQNFRQPMYFEYSRNNTVLGTSNLVQGNATIPQYGHIALTGINGQMRVMWNSGSNASIPTVRYGTNSSLLSLSASGSSSTFSIADTCMQYATQPRQFIDPGFQHDVVLTGLAPSTVYFYQFGNAQEGWSDVLSFTSAPVDGDASQPTRIIATADTGTYVCGSLIQNAESACEPWSQGTFDTIAQALQTYDAGVLLHVGDLAYAVGYQWTWEQFMVAIEPIATQLPYMVGIGNHEYDYLAQPFRPWWSNYMDDANGECGVPYSRRFHMPDVKGSPLSGLWYSFNYGLGHFVFMSTEHNFTVGSPQWNWIVADLAAVNRSVTPWVIFNGHRPMYYTDFLPDPNLVMAYFLRKNLEPVLLKYGVDLALWGHVHVYERTCAINDGACVTDGTGIVHAVIGNGGREIAPVNWSVAPTWSVYREKTFGWARITLTPSTLTFDFIANNDTQVHDSFVISKQ